MCTALTAALLLRDSAYCFDADVGNMMWQHTVAQMIAEELDASMYVAVTREIPTTGEKWFPPNTAEGEEAVRALLPRELFWDNLPSDHPHVTTCQQRNITFLDRPIDRRQRNHSDILHMKDTVFKEFDNLRDNTCFIILGYFQEKLPSIDNAKAMWNRLQQFPLQRKPQSLDIGIYLRCTPHYPFPSE